MTIDLTIIGLNKIGVSIGLALKNHTQEIRRFGHDRENSKQKKALELGALDQTPGSIYDAIESADIIILSVPIDEIRETIETISPKLKPGVVIMDTSPLKISILKMMDDILPEDSYFISFHPTLNPKYFSESSMDLDYAHDDLFKNSFIIITNSPKTDGEVIKLASDLSKFVGSSPYFADPFEIDGLISGTEILPKLIVAAYIHSLASQPGWKESQKVASNSYFEMSEIIHHLLEREHFGESAKYNKENTIRVLNNLLSSLIDMREFIENDEWDELQKFIGDAKNSQTDWKNNRNRADWDNLNDYSEVPSSGDFLLKMIGFGKKRKKPGN